MSYRVVLERDASGAWLARVPSVPGCHTYGRTLEQARRRIREALGLWVDDAETTELRYDVVLPTAIRRELRRVREARLRSSRAQREASAVTSRAAIHLTERLALSLRDAGELLGLSRQRVQQLVSASNPGNGQQDIDPSGSSLAVPGGTEDATRGPQTRGRQRS